MGYRNDNTSGIARGDESETMYMVTAGKHYNSGCCFDYGNAETDAHDHGKGTMEVLSPTTPICVVQWAPLRLACAHRVTGYTCPRPTRALRVVRSVKLHTCAWWSCTRALGLAAHVRA